jgi:amino acid adenylation domain-containing protein
MNYLIHHLLKGSARSVPDRLALTDGAGSLTYRELDDRSEAVAHLLVAQGVRRGDRVGVLLDKSNEAIVGIYAVLKAGAAYVPLDPTAPVSRLAYIASNCGIRTLLTESSKRASWEQLIDLQAGIDTFVVLDAVVCHLEPPAGTSVVLAHEPDRLATQLPELIDDDLAYILYTSGSTGQPKGVMLSHRNALGFVNWAADEFGLHSTDRMSSHAPLHFDLSILDIFGAARAGAAVVLVPSEVSVFPTGMADFVETHAITVWYSVPSVLSRLVQRGGLGAGRMPTLRLVLFAGEVFPTPYLRRLMDALPVARLCNLYGPTETNVCTYQWVSGLVEGDDRDIPIGRPIANVRTFVVSDGLKILPQGEVGELLVTGCTVMQGYWADEERTVRSLVSNPDGSAGVAYRTGDLVVDEGKGDFRFLGRRDNQIKSRGYRIELGEIETALHSHPDVVECAAVAFPDPVITNRIHAVAVVRGSATVRDLNRHCSEKLPSYMVPATLELIERLPRTSTGKIDRNLLAAVQRSQERRE